MWLVRLITSLEIVLLGVAAKNYSHCVSNQENVILENLDCVMHIATGQTWPSAKQQCEKGGEGGLPVLTSKADRVKLAQTINVLLTKLAEYGGVAEQRMTAAQHHGCHIGLKQDTSTSPDLDWHWIFPNGTKIPFIANFGQEPWGGTEPDDVGTGPSENQDEDYGYMIAGSGLFADISSTNPADTYCQYYATAYAQPCGGEKGQGKAFYEYVKGEKGVATPITTVAASSALECSVLCLEEDACRQFNVETNVGGGVDCELLKGDRQVSSPKNGSNYARCLLH